MKVAAFSFLVAATVAVAASFDHVQANNDLSEDMTFRDEIEKQTLARADCSTGKTCRRSKGSCLSSLETCNGRVVDKGCGTNCTCCVEEQHIETKWSSLIIPSSGTSKMSWVDAWSRCQSLDAQPFVPRTLRDFEVIKSVRVALGCCLWLPASDLAQEGVLRWWDGQDAGGSAVLMWVNGQDLYWNTEEHDCVISGGSDSETTGVHMWDCRKQQYPMICLKNN
ncbi:unnamed protein product [Meganyctiphanes norvegica]|uniref:C-type lectin domain-containing protein n=1 Tax=Meganyctiphanes norvegica TaxID=48144 RepID=A0AAV2QTE1_MEGNR